MKKELIILFVSLLSFSLSAQTFYNDHFGAAVNLDAQTATFDVKGKVFEGELQLKKMRSYPYHTVYFISSTDGLSTLAFVPQFEFRQDGDYIQELFILNLPIKKGIKYTMRNWGEGYSYSFKNDVELQNDYGSIKNGIDRFESESSMNERLEREKVAAEKRILFASETNLTEYIGIYQVKIGNYGGTNVSSLDFSAKLIITDEGVSLIGDFLTYGKISGTFKKDKAILDFDEGTFECFISTGFGDEMIVRVNQEKTAGAISRMSRNRPYDTITFRVIQD